jgi:uncharacterized protein with von Willebrand factor type A (vWA) domain
VEGRLLKFVAALRAGGVRISLAETADAFRAVDELGVMDRETFRLSLRSTLVKDSVNLPVFEELFPLFFGENSTPPMQNLSEDLTDEEASLLAQALREFAGQLREMLDRLIDGEPLSPEELEDLSRRVGLPGVDDMRYRDWMARRMQQALSFREVREALEDLMDIMAALGGDPGRLEEMRARMAQNQNTLEEQIRQFAGQRIAERMSEQEPQESLEALMNRPFSALSEGDFQRLRKEVQRLAAVLRTRVALRQRRAKSGQLDAKATIRHNLKHGNIPIKIMLRDRTLKPSLVVICDISTSMRYVSEMMLSLLYAMQDQIRKTHAFAFIDHLAYISPDFVAQDVSSSVRKILDRMPSGYYNTDLGNSLLDFSNKYMDMVDRRSTFILVGDGRNNYNNPRLEIFKKIARRSNRTIWINPESPNLWGTGDSDMLDYVPLCDQVLQVSNLADLTRAIDRLFA